MTPEAKSSRRRLTAAARCVTLATGARPSSSLTPLASDDHSYDYPVKPLGDPSKRAFTYMVLGGARFVYASATRLIAMKFISSMAMSEVTQTGPFDAGVMRGVEVGVPEIPWPTLWSPCCAPSFPRT